jgi:pilus assembly protein CpaE
VAAALALHYEVDVMLADMDLAFGSADLNFNLTPTQGIAEAIRDVDRLDEALLDRLLTACSGHLSLLAAPAALDETSDFVEGTFQRMIEVAQAHVPLVVLDVPHVWTAWTKKTLLEADEVVVTATPDLASLRNAKSLVTLLLQARPNDAPPKLVLNQVGMRKQHEISPAAFAKALDLAPISTIRFDPQIFGAAANNGKMIGDIAAKSDIASAFEQIAVAVAGRKEVKRQPTGIAGLFSRMGKW